MNPNHDQDAFSEVREYEVVGAPSARAVFITRTYLHLLGAIAAFVAIEWWLFSSGIAWPMAQAMLSTSWLLVLGGFMIVSRDKLKALPAETLAELAQSDLLELIYTHLQSVNNMSLVLKRVAARQGKSTADQNEESAIASAL